MRSGEGRGRFDERGDCSEGFKLRESLDRDRNFGIGCVLLVLTSSQAKKARKLLKV